MKETNYCQSCSMPLGNAALLGTESDGSPNYDYCKFCYQNGAFTHPNLTLDEMRRHMENLPGKQDLPKELLETALKRLPHLRRWQNPDRVA
jgi:hypothetical protein